MPDAPIRQRVEHREMAPSGFLCPLLGERRRQAISFERSEERRLLRTTRQQQVRRDAKNNRRQSFEDEQPAPAGEMQPVHAIENQSGNRRSKNVGDWLRDHEECNGPSLLSLPKPVGQIEQNAREKSGLRHAQQKSRGIELSDVLSKSRGDCDESPGDQNASDPNPRSDPVQYQVARDLEQEITKEEHAHDQPKLLAADREL